MASLVQYEHSRLTPLAPIPKLHSTPLPTPSQPVCNKPAPAPPHHNPPIKQLQPTQILANKNTNRATEQEEHEQEHQESEPYQHQEPEPEEESEALKINIPSKFLFTNRNPDFVKADSFFDGMKRLFKSDQNEGEHQEFYWSCVKI